MLSYRHGFHAGNFADVFKHIVLIYLIKNLKLISNITFIDGFAGGGKYFTENEFMKKKKEYRTGIVKLLNHKFDDVFIETYLNIVKKFNQTHIFKIYPGSGLIASEILDKKDNIFLAEYHSNEYLNLKKNINENKRIIIKKINTYKFLNKILSNFQNQKLVLIDPSYETKDEYSKVISLVSHAISQFKDVIFLIWYPILADEKHNSFEKKIIDKKFNFLTSIKIILENNILRMQGTGFLILNYKKEISSSLNQTLGLVLNLLKEKNKKNFLSINNYNI